MSRPLAALLEELERRLAEAGAPVASSLRPGVPERRVRAELEAAGAPAHGDIVAWFGWHDGAAGGDVPPDYEGPGIRQRPETTLAADWQLLPLADALRTRRWFLETAAGLVPESWLPLLGSGGRPVLCADAAASGPAPLHVIDDGRLPADAPQFDSVSEFVALLLRVFDKGLLGRHPEWPGVPWFEASRLEGELRRLAYW